MLCFFLENMVFLIYEIIIEMDCYILWFGQVFFYKMGEIKICELRKCVEECFGIDFEVCDFYDWVLENGSVFFDIFDDLVDVKIEVVVG